MRKFLLSAVALLMTATMLAVGNGSGSSQANAIDFDWDGTYIQEANNTSWHCIKLSNLNKEAEDPTVALYLTNLANETANVELSGSAVLKFPFPISLVIKDIDLLQYVGDDATETYSIEGKKHVVWTMPTTYDLSAIDEGQAKDALSELFGDLTNVSLIQLVEYGLSNVYLRVSSDKQIAIAADVYETAEIVDDACTKAVDFNWAGETVEAGETWFYLDLNAVKNSDKKLNFVVENNGAVEANVNFDLYADCPASAILLDYDWAIAAGSEVKEALGRFFLDQMTRDYVYLKLTTDQAVTLKAEEEVLPPPVELFNPSAAPVLEVGKEYVLNGETVLKVDLAALKAPKGYKTVCHIVNANGVAVNLKQEIAFSTPVTSNNVQEKNLLVGAGAALEINVPNKQVESVKSNVAYFRLTTDKSLTLWMEHVKLETKPVDPSAPSTPAILAPSCEDSYAFDWNSSIKQKALMTKWYELDIAPLKKNKEHVQLAFTNHTDAMVLVFGSILLDCNSKDTIPFVCPVPAGTPINKVLDYSLLAASPLQKAYVSLTMVPTKVKNLSDLASIRSKADVMNLIALDFGAEIEVKAKRISALVDPTACLNYQNLENGVEYTQEAGVTKWYRVTDEFVKNNLGLLEKFTIINQGSKDANVAFGVTVDCKCGIATTIDQKIPRWFDISTYSPTGLFRLVDAVVADEITEFYVSVKSDQPLLFGFDLDYGTTLGCDSAIVFDWEKGAVINSRDAQWYNFDLNTVKGSGSHLKLTFTNHSDEIVWVASAVSLTCPLKVVMPTVVPVLPGMNVDKVIDYSFVATNPINNVYVAVITEGKIELGATLIDATVEEPVDCVNHVEVKVGEKYTHKPGTTWYKFSNDLLADMGPLPKFTFENLSSNAISFSAGMTVDCKYGILTKVNAKIPAHVLGQHLHNREFSVRIPRLFFQAVRKLIDSDVTELLFQLTADNPFAFSIDPTYIDCDSAQDLLLKGCYELKANEGKLFRVNANTFKNLEESLNVTLYKENPADVTIEAEASPVCPMMLSITESKTIPFEDSLGLALSPTFLNDKLKEYSKYIGDDAYCYIRLKSNYDLTICVDTVPCDTCDPDPCKNPPLKWNDTISLKSLVLGETYKLDVTSIHNFSAAQKKKGVSLKINNDVAAGVTLITEIYADCMDDAPISGSYSEVTFNELGLTKPSVPYAKFESLGLTPEQTEMYLKVVDLVPVPCEDSVAVYEAICAGSTITWNNQTYDAPGTYSVTLQNAQGCDSVVTLHLSLINPTNENIPVYESKCATDLPYTWYVNGKSFVCNTFGEYEEVVSGECGTTTYVLYLSEINPTNDTIPVYESKCATDLPYTWYVNGKSFVCDTFGEYKEVVSGECGATTYVLYLSIDTDNCPCENIEEIDLTKDLLLSQFQSNTWYKVDLAKVTGDLSVHFVNDLTCAARVTAYTYATCDPANVENEIPLHEVENREIDKGFDTLAICSYDRFLDQTSVYDVDGYAYIYVKEVEQLCCENIEEIDLTKDLLLSQFQSNTWYKVDLAKVTGDLSVHFVNDLTCAASVTAYTYATCDPANIENEIPLHEVENREIALGFDTLATCSYDRFLDQTSVYDVDGYAYIYVKEVQTTKHTGYAVIKDTICDGYTYVDPITNEGHVIASYEPFTLTWTSTKSVSPCIDSVYTFEITPIVAPETITVAFLEEIGAMPKLAAGKKVDVSGTLETIQAYYDTHPSDTVAPVTKVYWTAGHEDLLDCDQTSHSMSLVVEAGCGFEVPATLTFDVTSSVTYGTTTETICESELPYTWYEHTLTEAGTATTTLVNAAGCDSIVTLTLVVNKPTYGTTTATICESELPYTWYEHTLTEAGTATTTLVNAAGCDSIVTLTLVVNKATEGDTIATVCATKLPYTWYEHTLTETGTATHTLVNAAGCDSIVTLHLTVEGQTPESDPATAPAKAVAKYGNRMILLHVNDFVAVNAWKPASDQVNWYQVVGELDNSWDALAGNGPDADKPLGSGLYIENLEGYTGQVYALIVESVEGESCGDVFRTEVLTLTPPAQAPQLVPTIASPNADLRLLNLNPSAVTEIRVYNTTGDLQAVYTASEVADFMFKAATTSGYYMVEVQSDGEKVTLRYIVK